MNSAFLQMFLNPIIIDLFCFEVISNFINILPINWHVMISALAGCLLHEFIYWFELRHEIAKGKIPPELNSRPYWIITILSVIIFSLGAYCYFIFSEDQANLNFFTIAIFSAGFPRLFKGAVQQIGNPNPHNRKSILSENSRSFTLKDFFMIKN